MSGPAPFRTVILLVVVLYLTAAGWFFILAPWTVFWSSRVLTGAPAWLVPALHSPSLRGLLSAFGVLHFAVAAGWLTAGVQRT